MRNLIASVKRYFIFGFLLIILLFLLWVKLFITPQISEQLPLISPTIAPNVPKTILSPEPKFIEYEIKQAPTLSDYTKLNYVFSGAKPETPSTLPVYITNKQPIINKDQAMLIAKNFGFEDAPNQEDKNRNNAPYFLWKKDNKSLFVGGSFPVITYYDYTLLTNTKTQAIQLDLINNQVKKDLDKFGISGTNSNSIKFFYYSFSDSGLNLIPDKQGASFVGVSLAYDFNGYSSLSNTDYQTPIFLTYDAQGNLFSLNALLFSLPSEKNSQKAVGFDSVLADLNSKSILFYAQAPEDLNQEEIPIYTLDTINLTEVKIKYFLPSEYNKTIKPYYIFTGTAKDKDSGKTVEVVVLVPATE